jgi:hypothetical protein
MSVTLFSAPVGGREANDTNNKAREQLVVDMLNNVPSTQDSSYIPLKTALDAWVSAKKSEMSLGDSQVSAIPRGGRRYNWDFDLKIGTTILKTEFKYGADKIDSLPEFFNPAANKDFHGELYARFFFNKYLPQVCAIYGITVNITEEAYLRQVHGTSKRGIFLAMYEAEKNGTEKQKADKKILVDTSIAEWLAAVEKKTNLAAITAAFQASQTDKHFLLFKGGKFYADKIEPEEMVATSVIGVRHGKYLVLQSAKSGTTHEMLLRWKNHAGILYPAWQISMKRDR